MLSSIAFIFRDEVDEWSQIDFGNETHVEMLEESVTSSLAKLTNPHRQPKSSHTPISGNSINAAWNNSLICLMMTAASRRL